MNNNYIMLNKRKNLIGDAVIREVSIFVDKLWEIIYKYPGLASALEGSDQEKAPGRGGKT